jgi:hypothetical protein
MTPERLGQIEDLCYAVLERAPGERGPFLTDACRGDDELLREVELLLRQNGSGGPLERPALQMAASRLNNRVP